ncbi:MAG: hypothetical protein IIV11_02185 [Clostridia bacterium]|nr:hypothetical protein [Clostridia bacterium]
MKKNSNFKIIIFYIILFAAVILALSFMFNQNREEKVTYSQIVDYFKSDRVAEFVVDDDFYIEMKVYEIDAAGNVLTSGDTKTIGYQLQSLGLFVEDCSEYYKSNQNLKSYDIEPETVFPWWVAFLPYIIVIVVLVILFFAMKNAANAGNGAGKMNSFGKARVKMPQNFKA